MKILDYIETENGVTLKSTIIIDHKFPGIYKTVCDADDSNSGIIRIIIMANSEELAAKHLKNCLEIASRFADIWRWQQTDYFKWGQRKTSG